MGAKKVSLVGASPSHDRLKDFLATSALMSIGMSKTLTDAHSSWCKVDDEAHRVLHAVRDNEPAMKIIVLGDPR
jgi:hypothetical protein